MDREDTWSVASVSEEDVQPRDRRSSLASERQICAFVAAPPETTLAMRAGPASPVGASLTYVGEFMQDPEGTEQLSRSLAAGMSRRSLLVRSALGLTLGPSALLAACNRSRDSGETGTSGLTQLGLQMVWVAGDTSMAGVWLAEDGGLFRKNGIKLDAKPAGDVDPTQIVLAGSEPLGVNGIPQLLAARAQGAPVKTVGLQFEKSPLAITARADAGINEFGDLRGKRIGVDPTSELLLEAILLANGISRDQVTVVTIGFNVTPLLQERIDAMISFATNEPYILQSEGIQPVVFLAYDYNLPIGDYAYFGSEKLLEDRRDDIHRFFAGAIGGWQEAQRDPMAAAKSVLSRQQGADPAQVEREVTQLTKDFLEGPYDASHGLFAMDPDALAKVSALLAKVGAISKDVAPSELIDASYLPSS